MGLAQVPKVPYISLMEDRNRMPRCVCRIPDGIPRSQIHLHSPSSLLISPAPGLRQVLCCSHPKPGRGSLYIGSKSILIFSPPQVRLLLCRNQNRLKVACSTCEPTVGFVPTRAHASPQPMPHFLHATICSAETSIRFKPR